MNGTKEDEVLHAACQIVSVNWTLSGDQVLRLYKQVQATVKVLQK